MDGLMELQIQACIYTNTHMYTCTSRVSNAHLSFLDTSNNTLLLKSQNVENDRSQSRPTDISIPIHRCYCVYAVIETQRYSSQHLWPAAARLNAGCSCWGVEKLFTLSVLGVTSPTATNLRCLVSGVVLGRVKHGQRTSETDFFQLLHLYCVQLCSKCFVCPHIYIDIDI